MPGLAARTQCVDGGLTHCGKTVIETFMHRDFRKFTIIEPCTAKSALVKFETKRFHKV